MTTNFIPDRCSRNYFITPLQNSSIKTTIIQPIKVWSAHDKKNQLTEGTGEDEEGEEEEEDNLSDREMLKVIIKS